MKTITLFVAVMLFIACSGGGQAVKKEVYAPSFAYQFSAKGESTGVAIALVKPNYSQDLSQFVTRSTTGTKYLDLFKSSLGASVEELLNVKGFNVKGPFESLDMMTFPEKKGSDLTLTPVIAVNINLPELQLEAEVNFWTGGTNTVYKTNGDCTITGYIQFVVYEPLSGEKMWFKQVKVEALRSDCSGTCKDLQKCPQLDDGVAKALEKAFQTTLNQADKYFNKEEILILKKQAQELRERKVY